MSTSEVHAIHSRCGSTLGDTMPSVNAVISSATKDCADAAVPRAAGNRSSMRSVSTGNANCAPMRGAEQQRLLQRDGHVDRALRCRITRISDAAKVIARPMCTWRVEIHVPGDAAARSSRRRRMPVITGRNSAAYEVSLMPQCFSMMAGAAPMKHGERAEVDGGGQRQHQEFADGAAPSTKWPPGCAH